MGLILENVMFGFNYLTLGMGAAILALMGLLGLQASHLRAVNAEKRELVAQIKSINELAAQKLDAENAKAKAASDELAAHQQLQEKRDAENLQFTGQLRAEVARLRAARDAGRMLLYAPGGGGGSGQPGPTAAGSVDRLGDFARARRLVPAAGDQSALDAALDAERFRADEINLAYIACRADAFNVRGMTPPN